VVLSCRSALSAIADLERFEVFPVVSLHPPVDFVLAEPVYQDYLAYGYDLGGKSSAQLILRRYVQRSTFLRSSERQTETVPMICHLSMSDARGMSCIMT